MISLIVAMGNNRVIGKNNQLLWNIPEDMEHFKKTTTGKTVIMGRKTYESIGKPLPKRKNVVLTRDKNFVAPGCIVIHTLLEALKISETSQETFVIGGEEIYKLFLPFAYKLYITKVDVTLDGDAFFPEFEVWPQSSYGFALATERFQQRESEYKYLFTEWEKQY